MNYSADTCPCVLVFYTSYVLMTHLPELITMAAERGGGAGGGATCPGPQASRGPQLEKYRKIEQGPIKIGASTRH